MNLETATAIGVDIIAPAATLFTILYAFRPWFTNHIGRAIMAHALGSALLFDLAVASQYGWIPEEYPGRDAVVLFIVVLWMVGWVYLDVALILSRRHRDETG